MEDPPKVPIIFANRVIQQFADHLLGGVSIKPRDYALMRLVFRKLKGNWQLLTQGDIQQLTLLERVVTGWNKMPGRKQETEEVEQV